MLAFIAIMIRTITKKYALNSVMLKLSVMIRMKIRKASITEGTKKRVIKRPFIEEKEWRRQKKYRNWQANYQKNSSLHSISLKRQAKRHE